MNVPYFLTGEEDKWDEYDHDEEQGEQYSSEDDISRIEEALLQRIHYAEDYKEDATDFPLVAAPAATLEKAERLVGSLSQDCAGQTFPNITVSSLGSADTRGGRSDVADDSRYPGEACEIRSEQFQGFAVNKTERTLESGNASQTGICRTKSAPKKRKEKLQSNVSGKSSPVREEGIPSSDEESKYKSIKSREASDGISGINDRKSGSQITLDSSDEDVGSVRKFTESQPRPKSPTLDAVDTAEPSSLSTKRQWRKSKDSPNLDDSGPATTVKKVKLKRSEIDAELRAALEAAKECLSEDELSDAMLIESHSEDEALDVHCESDQTLKSFLHGSHQPRSTKQRYYQDARFKCYNCSEFGHITKDCPKPKKPVTCILCGTQGHSDRKCPDALCYICSEPGHQAKECANKKMQYLTCHRCSIRGHTAKTCPDRWRQYHLTTEPGNIISCEDTSGRLTSLNGKVFCYNCSKEGHFGHECLEEPMDRHTPLILPYVLEYDYIPKRFWTVQMDTPEPSNTAFTDAGRPGQKVWSPSEQPPAVPKMLKNKTRRRLKREALALAKATGSQEMAASAAQMQGWKPKRKRKQLDDEDQVTKNKSSKKQRRENEEFEVTQVSDQDPSKLSKKERQRLKKEMRAQRRMNAVSDVQKETKMSVRNGRNFSGMRESRNEVFLEDVEIRHPYGKKAKTKKTKNSRYGKTKQGESYDQQQQMQHSQQLPPSQDQRVTFRPRFEQFPELERKFNSQSRDADFQPYRQDMNDIWLDNRAGIGSSEALAANSTVLSNSRKGKRKGKKSKLKVQNEEQNNMNFHHNVPKATGKGRGLSAQPKPFSKKRRKRQEAEANTQSRLTDASHQDWRNFKDQHRATGHQLLKSSRGFFTLPKS